MPPTLLPALKFPHSSQPASLESSTLEPACLAQEPSVFFPPHIHFKDAVKCCRPVELTFHEPNSREIRDGLAGTSQRTAVVPATGAARVSLVRLVQKACASERGYPVSFGRHAPGLRVTVLVPPAGVRFYLTQSVFTVILQISPPPKFRQLILYHYYHHVLTHERLLAGRGAANFLGRPSF